MPSHPAPLVRDAESLARRLLADDSDRLAHCRQAAALAEYAVDALGTTDGEIVIAAAWLHDIGHSPGLALTGFHPLDGALHLASQGWPDETVLLVAHHSHADLLARYFGVENQIAVLDHGRGDVEDLLTYADLHSGPTGMGAVPEERIAEMRLRDRSTSIVPKEVREGRYRLMLAAVDRVNTALNARPTGWSSRRRAHTPDGPRLGV